MMSSRSAYKVFWLLLPVIAACLINSCSSDRVIGGIGPREIDFELEIPNSLPGATFLAVSGIGVVTQKVQVGDSIVDSQLPSFYGQFTADTGVALPSVVRLNNVALERNLETDTLRLAGGGAGVDFSGLHTWTIGDSGEAPQTFQIGGVPVIDSVAPFPIVQTVRSDTSFHMQWIPSGDASLRMMLVWRAKRNATPYIQSLNDNLGTVTVPREAMLQLVGEGTVHLVRYRYIQQTFRGKPLLLLRTTQRSFDVTVLQ